MNLLQKIESRQATVAVIGLGYVGLPVAVAFGKAGFRVIGIDISEERIEALNRGESYIPDIPSAQVAALTTIGHSIETPVGAGPSSREHTRLKTSQTPTHESGGRLLGTTDFNMLNEADAAIICVPTPLGKTKDPDLSYVMAAIDDICKRLHPNMLIVLESTTYPGTTLELVLPRLQAATAECGHGANGNGKPRLKIPSEPVRNINQDGSSFVSVVKSRRLKVGKDFYLAFSPERIDPGRVDYTFNNTPKVIGGVTPKCTEIAQALYESVIDQVVPVSSPTVAEMSKLLENTFRAVNIALINEIAIMCNHLDIDVWEVIDAAKTKPFGFMPFYPGPGLGGHCIPIDPHYLAWKLKTLNYNARFIQLAAEINSEMPRHVLGKIAFALNEEGKAVNGSRVLVLGVAYKADVGDIRESPALDLLLMLQDMGADLSYHDPNVPHLDVNGINMTSVRLDRDMLNSADCVVITTAHNTYDWEWVVANSRIVVDTRNATKDVSTNPTRIIKL